MSEWTAVRILDHPNVVRHITWHVAKLREKYASDFDRRAQETTQFTKDTCPSHVEEVGADKMPQVTDLHRVYIQTLLSRRLIREDTALELFKRAIRAVKGESHTTDSLGAEQSGGRHVNAELALVVRCS